MLNLLHDMPPVGGVTDSEPLPISVDEYHRRIDAGILTKYDKVELIRGRLVPKMPRSSSHVGAVAALLENLQGILPPGWYARPESPITLADSEPEPDMAVARGNRKLYLDRHPNASELALVVEVSLSSLREDREDKRPMYAEAGIACYWIVNLIDFRIEVHTDPANGEYRQVRNYAENEPVPIVIDGIEIGRIALSEFGRG